MAFTQVVTGLVICAAPLAFVVGGSEPDTHEELAQRYLEEVWTNGNIAAIDELMTEDFVRVGPTPESCAFSREALKTYAAKVRTAYSDLACQVVETIPLGDDLLVRWSCQGTNTGDAWWPATGKKIDIPGTAILRFSGNRIAGERDSWDVLEEMRQLGIAGTMTDQRTQNLETVARFFHDVYGDGQLRIIPEIVDASHRFHVPSPSGSTDGIAGVTKRVEMFRTAFPDLEFAIEEMIDEGGLVAARWTFSGTHEGPFLGVEPTGKRISVSGLSMARLADGKIQESWGIWDTGEVLRQLGAGTGR